MALRQYTDRNGTTWNVWNIPSQFTPGRSGQDRRQNRAAGHTPERRTRHDRRVRPATGLEGGWVCFQAGEEKRRLVPVPRDWDRCAEEEMERYLSRAVPVPSRAGVHS